MQQADIPPAHLGYEEWTSGKNTLATESIVFAQTIIGYQKQFSTAITNLIQKAYIAIYSYTNEFNINFKNLIMALNPPRGITLATYAENLNNLNTIISTMKTLGIPDKVIINMFWPELYDQIVDAERLIEELNKNVKDKGQQQNPDEMAADMGYGTEGGGMDFGGGGDIANMGPSDTDLEGLLGPGGGGGAPPPEAAPPGGDAGAAPPV